MNFRVLFDIGPCGSNYFKALPMQITFSFFPVSHAFLSRCSSQKYYFNFLALLDCVSSAIAMYIIISLSSSVKCFFFFFLETRKRINAISCVCIPFCLVLSFTIFKGWIVIYVYLCTSVSLTLDHMGVSFKNATAPTVPEPTQWKFCWILYVGTFTKIVCNLLKFWLSEKL